MNAEHRDHLNHITVTLEPRERILLRIALRRYQAHLETTFDEQMRDPIKRDNIRFLTDLHIDAKAVKALYRSFLDLED